MPCQISWTSQEPGLRSQIKTVLADKGISIYSHLYFRQENPSHLLVTSLREKITCFGRKLLGKELSLAEMERVEVEIDKMGLSFLIIEFRGLGATYPAITNDQLKLIDTIKIVVEDLLYQYLDLKPLGCICRIDSFLIKRNPDAITMYKTLAGIVSKEVALEVHARYYSDQEGMKTDSRTQEFDFNAELIETRRKADQYLTEGKIELAERYMKGRREEFVAHGCHIRKLNQAYLAFQDILGEDSASVSPIYADLNQLRSKSPSLRHFLEQVAGMRSYAELTEVLRRDCLCSGTDQAEFSTL